MRLNLQISKPCAYSYLTMLKSPSYALWICLGIFFATIEESFAQNTNHGAVCEMVDDKGRMVVHHKSYLKLEDLCLCSEMTSLQLRKRNLAGLHPCFENLSNLESLDIRKSTISGFPKVLLNLRNLTFLSLAHTNIASLPDDFYMLESLRKLDLQGTSIKYLPDGLEHIDVIDFRMCELTKAEQESLKAQYPSTTFFFPSPCNCHH